ncbi:MAG TPA: amidase, partial [Gammaproteobacteria bacterium]|nr:amidase [Gammaproteobacteria bacterium]
MSSDGADLCFAGARELAAAIAARRVSAVEVMRACLARIDALDGLVNALPTRVPPDELLAAATAADQA